MRKLRSFLLASVFGLLPITGSLVTPAPLMAQSLNEGARLNQRALKLKEQGRYAEAEPLFKRALAIYEKSRGPDHPFVATSLNNLADLYWTQGRYAEAEPLLKRALAIYEKTLGPKALSDKPERACEGCWSEGIQAAS